MRLTFALVFSLLMVGVALAEQTKIYPSDDVYVISSRPDENQHYGSYNEVLGVGSCSKAPHVSAGVFYRLYLKFSLSSLPSNADIQSAYLYLTHEQTYSMYALSNPYCYYSGGGAYGSSDFTMYISRLNDNWNELSLTWNNAPAIGSQISTHAEAGYVTTGFAGDKALMKFDVSNYIRSEFVGDKIVSFGSKSAETSNLYLKNFYSKDSGTSVSPYLEVTYTVPTPSPTPTPTPTPTPAPTSTPTPTPTPTATTGSGGGSSLSISVSASNPNPEIGEIVTFTATVINSGPQTASNVYTQIAADGTSFCSDTRTISGYSTQRFTCYQNFQTSKTFTIQATAWIGETIVALDSTTLTPIGFPIATSTPTPAPTRTPLYQPPRETPSFSDFYSPEPTRTPRYIPPPSAEETSRQQTPSPVVQQTPIPTLKPIPTSVPTLSYWRDLPSVSLTSTKSEAQVGQDALLTLSIINPGVNDYDMVSDIVISVPSGVSVEGSSFVTGGANQYVGTSTARPGQPKYITLRVKANEAGEKLLQGTATYYPAGNKDAFEKVGLSATLRFTPMETHTQATPTPTPRPTPKPPQNLLESIWEVFLNIFGGPIGFGPKTGGTR